MKDLQHSFRNSDEYSHDPEKYEHAGLKGEIVRIMKIHVKDSVTPCNVLHSHGKGLVDHFDNTHTKVILFGTIPTTILDTTPSVISPTTHIDTTPIPIVSPTIPLSPDYTPALPDYSPASDTEFDLSEDPSSDHIPPLPATSPFLSLTDDSLNSDIPDTPPLPTHDENSGVRRWWQPRFVVAVGGSEMERDEVVRVVAMVGGVAMGGDEGRCGGGCRGVVVLVVEMAAEVVAAEDDDDGGR
ncbi:hypothetical protein Tco_0857156 [Tanacetum coccineum]|uniref:Uncharacterized protein n=1 Tax=Tanacetum coccineum TaxID=301880 RepID=A0ABQ5B7A2_9ASTR